MSKSLYTGAFLNDKGFNTDVNCATTFSEITLQDKIDAIDARQHLIDETRKRLFGIEDTED